jgi:hypothetical protein
MNWDGHQTRAKTNKDSVNEPEDEVTPEIEAAIKEFIR